MFIDDDDDDFGWDYDGELPQFTRRETEMRTDLYRAIYEGDLEKAEDVMNLMAMVDIDRDEIWTARKVRVG